MKLYCQNRFCDFEFEDNVTGPMPMNCPKCGGARFGTQKDPTFVSGPVIVSEPPAFWLEPNSWDSSSMNWGKK